VLRAWKEGGMIGEMKEKGKYLGEAELGELQQNV
jgi:hypothetical protein